jgi:hypothetical protein
MGGDRVDDRGRRYRRRGGYGGQAWVRHYAAVTGIGCAGRMSNRYLFAGPAVAAAVGLFLLAASACSSGSADSTPPGSGGAGTAAASAAAAVPGQSPGKTVDGCTLVTAQQLSQAAGVKYTAIQDSGSGSICNVTGASATDSFYYHVDKEDGSLNTWSGELAIIKEDDGSYTSVSGIGDRAAQGAVKEFAAESGGYIVVVVNADVNNPPTESSFARTRKIGKLLISKL